MNTGHLEQGFAECGLNVILVVDEQGYRDDACQNEDGGQEPAEFLIAEHLGYFAFYYQVEQPEVEAGNNHKGRNHILDERRIPIGYTGLFGRISAGSGRGEGVTDGIEPVHATDV